MSIASDYPNKKLIKAFSWKEKKNFFRFAFFSIFLLKTENHVHTLVPIIEEAF